MGNTSEDCKIEIGVKTLESILSSHLKNMWTVTTLVTLSVGWVLTSEEARTFIDKSPFAIWFVTILILAIAFIQFRIAYFHRQESKELFEFLETKLNSEYYKYYLITDKRFKFNISLNILLLVFLVTLLWSIKIANLKEILI